MPLPAIIPMASFSLILAQKASSGDNVHLKKDSQTAKPSYN
jgi:hypothetical protein